MTRGTKILVVYTAVIPTTTLIMEMMQRLIGITDGKLHSKKSVRVSKADISWADIILFVRGMDPYMEKIGKSAHEAGRYCIMYLDDDLLNVPSGGIDIYQNALKGCLYWCDLLWSSNPNILSKYSQFMRVPKCVEEKVFEAIDHMVPFNEDTERIKIVYAGSPSHAINLQQYIVPALNNLYKKYENIDVTFIGLQKDNLKSVLFEAEYVPWFYDLEKYKNFIAQNRYHIGLAVVEDSEFYRCKYYNKFLEYCKMGVLGIYSDCQPYQFIVKDHENGLLSQNSPKEWEKNIEEAITDHELRKKCVENAQELLQREFNMDTVLHQFIEKVPECAEFRADESYEVHYIQYKRWKAIAKRIYGKIFGKCCLIVHYMYKFTIGRIRK